MASRKSEKLVSEYLRMWPRKALTDTEIIGKGKQKGLTELKTCGVYVLYKGDQPSYVGRAANLRGRLWSHANDPTSPIFHSWDYFSAFFANEKLAPQLEAILIAAMRPRENKANPKIKKLPTPKAVKHLIKQMH